MKRLGEEEKEGGSTRKSKYGQRNSGIVIKCQERKNEQHNGSNTQTLKSGYCTRSRVGSLTYQARTGLDGGWTRADRKEANGEWTDPQ